MPHRLDITQRLHQRMLEIVGSVLPLVTSSMRDADLDGIAFLRHEMIDAIEAYCRHIHQHSESAQHAQDAFETAKADALAEGCTALRSAYHVFRVRWADRKALEHWPEYRLSAIVMMKHIRNSVRQAAKVLADQDLSDRALVT